jgi:hypothetical protein
MASEDNALPVIPTQVYGGYEVRYIALGWLDLYGLTSVWLWLSSQR